MWRVLCAHLGCRCVWYYNNQSTTIRALHKDVCCNAQPHVVLAAVDMFDAVAARVGTQVSKELLLPPMIEIFEHCNKINEDSEAEDDNHPMQYLLGLRKKMISKRWCLLVWPSDGDGATNTKLEALTPRAHPTRPGMQLSLCKRCSIPAFVVSVLPYLQVLESAFSVDHGPALFKYDL